MLHLALGSLFLLLAVLGALLPLLPTTPFLLLASASFARSSPRAQAWLRQSRLFGPLLADWERERGVRPHVKATAIVVVLGVVVCSLLIGALSALLRALLLLLAAVGLVVVWRLRTVTGPRQGTSRGAAAAPATGRPAGRRPWH